jgi:capsular exopolysaccharide synthesis family protein
MSKNFELLRRARKAEVLEIGERSRAQGEYGYRRLSAYDTNADKDRFDGMRAWAILKKRWMVSILFAVCMFATVAAITFLMKPVYAPVAAIQIDPPGTTFSLEPRGEGADNIEYLETAVKNLQSTDLLLDVIEKLRLVSNREFYSPTKESKQPDRSSDSTAVQLPPEVNSALRHLRAVLKVERDPQSRLITVSVASHDPRLAAAVTNTLVIEFIEETFKSQHNAITESSSWVSKQLDDIRGRMEQANRALMDFQTETGIIDVDTNKSSASEQIAEFNRQLAQAQADRIQAESYLKEARSGDAQSLPQVEESKVVQDLRSKLGETNAELMQSQVIYGKNHPTIRKLETHVSELQRQLDAQKRTIIAELSTRYSAALQRERLLHGQLKSTAEELNVMARYNALKKEAQTETELYNSLYARVKEAGIAAAAKSNNMRIVDKARVLDVPTRPKTMLNLIAGLLAGIIGGLLLAFVVELLDNRLHTPEDIVKATGFYAISILPVIGDSSRLKALGLIGGKSADSSHRLLLDRPGSIEAEAMRSLHTNIMLSRRAEPPKVIVMVSAFPREGKTTVASNLAIILANHCSTCLVDADLRKAELTSVLKVHSHPGLAEVLAGVGSLEEAIVSVPEVPNLSILPPGRTGQNPADLMAGNEVIGTIEALRMRFEFVVIDPPPILRYAEARILSTLADGIVLVGRCGTTTRDAMARTIDLLAEIHAAPIVDIVLNAAPSEAPGYSYQSRRYST